MKFIPLRPIEPGESKVIRQALLVAPSGGIALSTLAGIGSLTVIEVC